MKTKINWKYKSKIYIRERTQQDSVQMFFWIEWLSTVRCLRMMG